MRDDFQQFGIEEKKLESEDWSDERSRLAKLCFDFIKSKEMDYRVASLESRMDLMDKQFDSLISEMKSLRWWFLGTGIGAVVAIIAAVVCLAQYQASWFQSSINANQEANRSLLEEMDKRWQAINAEQQKRHEIMLKNIE